MERQHRYKLHTERTQNQVLVFKRLDEDKIKKFLDITLNFDLKKYTDGLKRFFLSGNTIFIDKNIIGFTTLDIFRYLINKLSIEGNLEKLEAILKKGSNYTNIILEEIRNNERIVSIDRIIGEIFDGCRIYKRELEDYSSVSNSKNKKALNFVKESLREMSRLEFTIANILDARLKKMDYCKHRSESLKRRLYSLFETNREASQNDRELVYLFMNESRHNPSMLLSRDNDIKELMKIIIDNIESVNYYSEYTLVPSVKIADPYLYTVAAFSRRLNGEK